MFSEIIDIKVPGSQENTHMDWYYFQMTEELKDSRKRPVMVLCPGGGYSRTSDREADPIAMQFLARGFHVAIIRYSCEPARYPTAMLEVARGMAFLRTNAEKYCIDSDHIFLQGCSAGGHLAACYATHWTEEFLTKQAGVTGELLRPNGLLLCYPVITSGEFAHRESFECLLGDRYEELKDQLSLEYCVNEQVPPTFLWHTFQDDCVPVENSLLFVSALRKQGISTEFHLFPHGHHGLSVANEFSNGSQGNDIEESCQDWVGLAVKWAWDLANQ